MYGKVGSGSAGVGGASLAATGFWFDSLALLVAAATLFAAGLAVYKLAPRIR